MECIGSGVIFDASVAEPHERCAAFNSLVRLADGSMICGFKCGPEKLSPMDRLVLMKSRDGGKIWFRLFDGFDTTFENTPGSYCGGHLVEPEPGRLLICLHWIDRSDPTRPLSNPVTAGVLPMKCLLAESQDAGRSWSSPREVSLAPHVGANPTGPVLLLGDGAMLLPYESWREWDAVEGEQSANVKRSVDGGRSWSDPITMAHDPSKHFYFWDNRLARQPGTDRLLAAFWTHEAPRGIDAPIHLAWGEPDGTRWSAPRSTPIKGQVSIPVFLDERRLLLVYVHRHDPPSIRAVLSEDGGQTWDLDRETVIYECGRTAQAGIGRSRSEAEYWDDMTRWTFGLPRAIRWGSCGVYVVFYAPPATPRCGSASPALSIHWALIKVDAT